MQKAAACGVLVAKRGLAYDTVVSIVEVASQKAQMVHNAEVQAVETDAISEAWNVVIRWKKQKRCLRSELEMGDC